MQLIDLMGNAVIAKLEAAVVLADGLGLLDFGRRSRCEMALARRADPELYWRARRRRVARRRATPAHFSGNFSRWAWFSGCR